MYKKIIFNLLLSIVVILFNVLPTFAVGTIGDGGAGGGFQNGSTDGSFYTSIDGVRVTVIELESKTIKYCRDWSKYNVRSSYVSSGVFFGYTCKLQYSSSSTLTPQITDIYRVEKKENMPQILPEGTSLFEGVKKYFADKGTVQKIADLAGIKYQDIIDEKYIIMLEPLVHVVYTDSVYYIMTATEAALFDKMTSGGLRRSWIQNATLKNLPIAMFLNSPDPYFNIPTHPSKVANGRFENDYIIERMGVMLLHGKDVGYIPSDGLGIKEYTFYTDTDVIVSADVQNGSGQQFDPGNELTVTFSSSSHGTYSHADLNLPEGESRLAWFDWHTPSTPTPPGSDGITFNVSANDTSVDTHSHIICHIIPKPEGNEPPDPQGEDKAKDFSLSKTPPGTSTPDPHTWSDWNAKKIEGSSGGTDQTDTTSSNANDGADSGDDEEDSYELTEVTYTAQLNVGALTLSPDEVVPKSTYKNRFGNYTIHSGYGINCSLTAGISGTHPSGSVTPPQYAVAAFPEFGYSYDSNRRVLAGSSSGWGFAENEYSQTRRPVHFTPVWYPDNTDYIVSVRVDSAWTPVGELTAVVNSDNMDINGSVFDDWFVQRTK